MKRHSRWIVVLSTGLSCLGAGTSLTALAQQSNFGTVSLSPGFNPDPHSVQGRSGGEVNASTLGTGCNGWIDRNPDHIFSAQGAFSFLRVFAESSADTTLVIQRPNGTYTCNDDAVERNPAIQESFAPGTYKVWIGSYESGTVSNYTLKFTEIQGNQPAGNGNAAAGGGTASTQACGRTRSGALACVDANAPRPSFGCRGRDKTCRLSSGFTPDPWAFRLTAGGGRDPINVSSLNLRDAGDNSQCGDAWITGKPDFRFVFETGADFAFLRFYVQAAQEADATLLINTPNGRWRCNDDSHGTRNPTIDFTNPQAGRYDIWVGSYGGGSRHRATLNVTELQQNHP